MNLIFIMLDSLRQDHVSTYNQGKPVFDGIKPCATPNIDKFAQQSVVFDNVYPQGLPTIPVRFELMTGQTSLPYRPWQPLTNEDKTVCELLRKEGYITGFITDCYHYRAPNMNYHRWFNCYRWIRGQEYDPYVSSPSLRNVDDYVNDKYPDNWRNLVHQYLANTDEFKSERDWFSYQVMSQSADWLDKNRVYKNTFLWVDSFEPHEPWDPPKKFDTYTDPNYKGKRLILPMGLPVEQYLTPSEINHIRGLYAGEASFVDHCCGLLFDKLEQKGYYDDSLVVLTADHGHPLADHGKFLKGDTRLYSELIKVPFMMRFPKGQHAGKRVKSLIQFPDVLPTIFDILGFGNNSAAMHGKSYLPVIKGDTDKHRESTLTGFFSSPHCVIRDEKWSYIHRDGTVATDELYDLVNDPREKNNVIIKHKKEADRLKAQHGRYFVLNPGKHVDVGLQEKYELGSSSG
jgi:arylsulfatase A-like enzyme